MLAELQSEHIRPDARTLPSRIVPSRAVAFQIMPKVKQGRATLLTLKDLVRDPRLQVRFGGTNPEHVEDIAEYAKKNGPFKERLKVYKTCLPESINVPAQLFLIGGFNRVEGYELAGVLKAPGTIYEGTWAEALQAAAAENAEHLGLRRTRADKRRAVQLMLEADKKLSAREIARHIQCSHPFVCRMIRELSGEEVVTLPPKKAKDDGVYNLTEANGVHTEPEPEEPEPGISGPAKLPNPPRQGEEQEFRWGDAALMIGSLVKMIDKCANVYKRKKSLEHQGLLRQMTEVEKQFKDWADWCKKEAAKEGKK